MKGVFCAMKEIVHDGYDMLHYVRGDVSKIDECFMSNLEAPVVRVGSEPFKSYYPIEWYYFGYHTIDPSRSFAQMMIDQMNGENDTYSHWPAADMFEDLIVDLGFDYHHLTHADLVAFWTMFPIETADFLANSFFKRGAYLKANPETVRVLNNPRFYVDPNPSEKRLVEIADVNGFRFALDRANVLPAPEVLAREITLLNFGMSSPESVDAKTEALTKSIAETMDDWGLVPQATEDET